MWYYGRKVHFTIIVLLVNNITKPAVNAFACRLNGLLLILLTAGVYLRQTSTNFADYLNYYKDLWLKLQKISPELFNYKDRTLHTI